MSEPRLSLTGNQLKLLAAGAMLVDHIGLMFFPSVTIFRIIGRLAFPIFAFMIAEGCKYTRNRLRYFLQLFVLALGCQVVYFIADGSLYLSVLFTFSLAALTIFALQHCKAKPGAISFLLLATTVAAVYVLNQVFDIDYGFFGCMLPVFAALLHGTTRDSLPMNTTMLGVGLVFLGVSTDWIQCLALMALPLLYAYNGKRGQRNLKYFFYIFYPTHLVVLEGIAMLIWYLR